MTKFNLPGIYSIKNRINFHQYVGSSINVQKRMNIHKSTLNKKIHENSYLQNAWNKYGNDNFEFLLLEEVGNKENLITREQYYIDTLNPEYNINKIAGSCLGFKHSKIARENMSKGQLKRYLNSPGTRKGVKFSKN